MVIAEVLLLGFVGGFLVGLMGIGGGIVLVPLLVYVLHMTQHAAQGTSLLVLLPPIGAGALYLYWKEKSVDLPAGLLCALAQDGRPARDCRSNHEERCLIAGCNFSECLPSAQVSGSWPGCWGSAGAPCWCRGWG